MAITLKTIEKKVDQIALLRNEASQLEGQLKEVKNALAAMNEELIDQMRQAGTTMIKTEMAAVSISHSQKPRVIDWAAFDAWVIKHKAPELFERRVSVSAWRERADAGVVVPGVEIYEHDQLNFRTVKA